MHVYPHCQRSNSSETAAECRNIMNELLNFWFSKADFGCDKREETTITNANKWTTSSLNFEETENPIGTELIDATKQNCNRSFKQQQNFRTNLLNNPYGGTVAAAVLLSKWQTESCKIHTVLVIISWLYRFKVAIFLPPLLSVQFILFRLVRSLLEIVVYQNGSKIKSVVWKIKVACICTYTYAETNIKNNRSMQVNWNVMLSISLSATNSMNFLSLCLQWKTLSLCLSVCIEFRNKLWFKWFKSVCLKSHH